MTLEVFLGYMETVANWAVPVLLLFIPLYATFRGVKVYEVFVSGAKEGFDIAVKIMPYLVAILVAIGIFRDVNGMLLFSEWISAITGALGMPPALVPGEILPMAIVRPLSGSGALGVMNSIFVTYGADGYLGILASVMMGSTETTFYVLAVYFGSVNIQKSRHAVLAGLAGDFAGIIASVVLCYYMFPELREAFVAVGP